MAASRLSNHRTVVAGDGDHARAWNIGDATRPSAVQTVSAGVLDSHEHRAAVWRKAKAGNFAGHRPDQKATDLARFWIGGEHLVVAMPLEVARIRVISVRLNPQDAMIIECDAVWRVEHVAGIDV